VPLQKLNLAALVTIITKARENVNQVIHLPGSEFWYQNGYPKKAKRPSASPKAFKKLYCAGEDPRSRYPGVPVACLARGKTPAPKKPDGADSPPFLDIENVGRTPLVARAAMKSAEFAPRLPGEKPIYGSNGRESPVAQSVQNEFIVDTGNQFIAHEPITGLGDHDPIPARTEVRNLDPIIIAKNFWQFQTRIFDSSNLLHCRSYRCSSDGRT